MKNRHETPVTMPQFGCNALMNSQMRKIMSGRGACFVSIFVYFCLLLPPTDPNLHQPTSFTNQRGKRVADRVFDRTGVRQTGPAARLRNGGRAYVCRPPSETQRMDPYHARSVRPRSATLRCVSLSTPLTPHLSATAVIATMLISVVC